MLGGLRLVSIQRGHDPRTFTLVAFGGAGPLHANAMLELLDSPLCVIPPAPGIFSTFGFLAADVQREFSRSHVRRLSALTPAELGEIVHELAGQAHRWLESEGFAAGEQRLAWQFGMRYFRQGYELPVVHDDPAADPELPSTLAGRFEEAHRRFYQFDLEVEPELVVVRCIATGLKPRPELRAHEDATEPVEAAVTDPEHVMYRQGGWVQAPIYARERLQPGHELPHAVPSRGQA